MPCSSRAGVFLFTFAALNLAFGQPQERRGPSGPGDRTSFTMLREEGFPLNVNPQHVPAKEARLEDGDMVLGVVINGQARAYPVNYMNGPQNEVVNDTLGGTPIAPSW